MTEPRSRWMPPVPGPLQRLFDHFPLTTYPANDLPCRSPGPSELPALYVFVSEEGATKGDPSFNPSCLKWQTLLKFAGVRFRLVSSTNHASPTGALPFLLPPAPRPPSSSPRKATPTTAAVTNPTTADRPVPSSSLLQYAIAHGTSPIPSPPPPLRLRHEAYQALLDGPVRAAWLHALYLTPSNAPVLQALYLDPATACRPVRATLHAQLRRAAAAEVAKWTTASSPYSDVDDAVAAALYAEAASAFDALASLLAESGDEHAWFSGARPGELDAAVFAYTQPLLAERSEEGALGWRDQRLPEAARRAGDGALVRHRARIWDLYYRSG
ncbi:hypothetical protein VTK73DRAFT_5665 [Phialemonium thermophilum]|uniref:Thioredoxin-like fold domain-containing protein n=1 Tax=Phialemonium thermophilum TaxID=223376 RepID=A0ABR3WMA1_9PEZI